MKFDVFNKGNFIGRTQEISSSDIVSILKLHVMELLSNLTDLDDIVILLKNNDIISSETFDSLTFSDLGLKNDETYSILILSKQIQLKSSNEIRFSLTNINDNNSEYILNFCSKNINCKEALYQPCVQISETQYVCLACAVICNQCFISDKDFIKTIKNKEIICDCDTKNLDDTNKQIFLGYKQSQKCFFNGINSDKLYDGESKLYSTDLHKKEIDLVCKEVNKYEKVIQIEDLKEKTLKRDFNFEKSLNYGMTRIYNYGTEEVTKSLNNLFNEDLMNVLNKRTKEDYESYLNFINTGSGLSEYDMKKHEEALKFRHEIAKNRFLDYNDYFVKSLLFWFKKEFFTWCDKPICKKEECFKKECKGDYVETVNPNSDETKGQASRTEIYKCSNCKAEIRFPRYNSCVHLIESKTGRCGEWANLFGAILTYFNYETRFVDNFEDHVWNEYYSTSQKRWIHLDPCEKAYDTPLLYEQGWGRNMTYVLAYSRNGVYDVTRRYVKDYDIIKDRRKASDEKKVEGILDRQTQIMRAGIDFSLVEELIARDEVEIKELIEKVDLNKHLSNLENFKERESGSDNWKKLRGEMK